LTSLTNLLALIKVRADSLAESALTENRRLKCLLRRVLVDEDTSIYGFQ